MPHHRVVHPFPPTQKNWKFCQTSYHKETFHKSANNILNAKDLLEIQRLVLNLQFDKFSMERMAETITWVRKQQQNKIGLGFLLGTTINWPAACANAFLEERSKAELTDLTNVMQAVSGHLLPNEYQSNNDVIQYIASMQEIPVYETLYHISFRGAFLTFVTSGQFLYS